MSKGKPRYAVELKPERSPASFMAGGKAVELDEKNNRFETDDRRVWLQIRALPFLNDLGEVDTTKAKES